LDTLAASLEAARPDVTVIVSDDQDEWFYDSNMPSLAIYWGDSVPLIPRTFGPEEPSYAKYRDEGYGDVAMDVPVRADLGRHLIEYLVDHDFDVAHVRYVQEAYQGRVARLYPSIDRELDLVQEKPVRAVGLPHGFSFVVKRLFDNRPSPILPVFQNTCYPPNNVRPARAYDLGRGLAQAVALWPDDLRVAVVASGGLSHFVVDEELDRMLLEALVKGDAEALRHLPRQRFYAATSESLNWVTVAGAMADNDLKAEVVDYVPVYRTDAGTGGGWAFMQWTSPASRDHR
jgi:3-O-methylgallate 3,4-dioxygenase